MSRDGEREKACEREGDEMLKKTAKKKDKGSVEVEKG